KSVWETSGLLDSSETHIIHRPSGESLAPCSANRVPRKISGFLGPLRSLRSRMAMSNPVPVRCMPPIRYLPSGDQLLTKKGDASMTVSRFPPPDGDCSQVELDPQLPADKETANCVPSGERTP